MIPAILIIVLLLLKVEAIVALGISAVAAGAVSIFCQVASLQSVIQVAYNSYTTAIEKGILQTILNRGGMSSMLQYVAIICFAVGMGGTLILAVLLVGYVVSRISCSQPIRDAGYDGDVVKEKDLDVFSL